MNVGCKRSSVSWGLVGFFALGCDEGVPSPRFPADFSQTYLEMRSCRHSHEHELRHIRVFANPRAQLPYKNLNQGTPYPEGATLVKLEYELAGCNPADLVEYTVMYKGKGGEGDWLWQRVSVDRVVQEEGNIRGCINCHTVHCTPPFGYDLSCAEEL
ncbi:MAG: cytochrome P460 family protein [Deltaproteobacteria bacterium]|nr:cytochrome P460 family protein [Deltaproteobacteria bacterium]